MLGDLKKLIEDINKNEKIFINDSIALLLENELSKDDLRTLLMIPELHEIIGLKNSSLESMASKSDKNEGGQQNNLNNKNAEYLLTSISPNKLRSWQLLWLYFHGIRYLYLFSDKDTHANKIVLLNILIERIFFLHYSLAIKAYSKLDKYRFTKAIVRYIGESYYKLAIKNFLNHYDNNNHSAVYAKKNKVHYFVGSLGPGGSERQLVNTSIGIIKKGWRVEVSYEGNNNDSDKYYVDVLEQNKITVRKIKKDINNYKFDKNVNNKLREYLINFNKNKLSPFEKALCPYILEILESKPQVVHAWLDHTNVMVGLSALVVGVPRIILSQRSVAPDNFLLYSPKMKPAYLALIRSSRVTLINNSYAGAQDYYRWLGLESKKINVIYNGYNSAQKTFSRQNVEKIRQQFNIPLNAPVVGSVFRFYEEKRPFLWIDIAFEVLKLNPSVYFLLAGDGILRPDAEKYAKKLGVEPRIKFTGVTASPLTTIKAMDVFLLCSRKEGLPNVLIEAQAVGVPVVSTDAGGASETVINGETGYIIDDSKPEKIAAVIVKMLDNKIWLKKAGIKAAEFANNKFAMERMITETVAIYN